MLRSRGFTVVVIKMWNLMEQQNRVRLDYKCRY